jgi:hypothetical protein
VRHLLVLATALLALTAATAATASAQATASAERFVLSGVVAFDDGDGKAWLQEPRLTGNRVVLVRRGDSVGPWRVTAIHKNRVELTGPGGAIFVPLHNADGAAVAAAGGPAPAAAAASPAPEAPSVPLGDPSRREPIRQLTDVFQQAGARAPAQPAPASSLPDFSGKPLHPTDRPPKTLYFGAGDPSRRETMGQIFGPR